ATAQRCQADLEVGVWVLPSVLVIAAVVGARACGSLAVVWLSGVRQNGQICHSGRTTWLHCGQWGSVATGTPAGRVIWALASPSLPVPGAAFSVCSGVGCVPLGAIGGPCCVGRARAARAALSRIVASSKFGSSATNRLRRPLASSL